jgi:hypothetical protein
VLAFREAPGVDHDRDKNSRGFSTENTAGERRDLNIVLTKAATNGRAPSKPPMAEPESVTARMIRPGIGPLRVAFLPGVNGQKFARALDGALRKYRTARA